jgi:hypothetical protein
MFVDSFTQRKKREKDSTTRVPAVLIAGETRKKNLLLLLYIFILIDRCNNIVRVLS